MSFLGWPLKPIDNIGIYDPPLKPLGKISNIPGAYPDSGFKDRGRHGRNELESPLETLSPKTGGLGFRV